jgi:hypothetical protein
MRRSLIFALVLICLPLAGGRQSGDGIKAVVKMAETPQDNLKSQIERLASEHAHERDAARDWLLAHPALSRPALLEIMQAGRRVHLAQEAIYLLGQMGNESDVMVLADVLKRAEPRLVWDSAQALGSHDSDSALLALLDSLKHTNPEVAGAAAVALGVRGDERAREPLERLLTHAHEEVRHRAVFALQKLGIAPSAIVLRKHREQETSADVLQLIDEALKESSAGSGK